MLDFIDGAENIILGLLGLFAIIVTAIAAAWHKGGQSATRKARVSELKTRAEALKLKEKISREVKEDIANNSIESRVDELRGRR